MEATAHVMTRGCKCRCSVCLCVQLRVTPVLQCLRFISCRASGHLGRSLFINISAGWLMYAAGIWWLLAALILYLSSCIWKETSDMSVLCALYKYTSCSSKPAWLLCCFEARRHSGFSVCLSSINGVGGGSVRWGCSATGPCMMPPV